ncbi:unnamed protein product [Cochlearia groenlandica]
MQLSVAIRLINDYYLIPKDDLSEKIGSEVYESLKVYEKAFEDLDEMNLMVQYLVKEGRCTIENIKKHLKLSKETVMDAYNINAKLKDVIWRGLLEKEEYEHMEFMRINRKFQILV